MSKFEDAISVILAHEGGWVNDAADPGGETNFGWSTKTIQALGLKPADLGLQVAAFTPGCLKQMTKDAAVSLYKRYFWNQYGYGNVNDQTAATKMFDAAVNMGPGKAATFAQQACNALGITCDVDGSLGPKSFEAINACNSKSFIQAYADQMKAYYLKIIERNPALAKFQKTWLLRAQWGV